MLVPGRPDRDGQPGWVVGEVRARSGEVRARSGEVRARSGEVQIAGPALGVRRGWSGAVSGKFG